MLGKTHDNISVWINKQSFQPKPGKHPSVPELRCGRSVRACGSVIMTSRRRTGKLFRITRMPFRYLLKLISYFHYFTGTMCCHLICIWFKLSLYVALRVEVYDGGQCSSSVGREGGKQSFSLGRDCQGVRLLFSISFWYFTDNTSFQPQFEMKYHWVRSDTMIK